MTDAPILIADQLSRHYKVRTGWLRPPATVQALQQVSFTLARGQTLAVLGESGCGKSTLARQLTMIEPATSGRLLIDGADVTAADAATRRRLRATVQMVFQNPYTSLNPRQRIAATLDEPLRFNTSLARQARRDRIAAMAERVGLRPEHLERYPHMFSGGQRQRVAIARAMLLRPPVVVADEPTSALDVSIQAQILNLFMDLQDEFATSYVFISHNLAVVRHVAHQVLVMYLGAVVESGSASEVLAQPLHPYTQALVSAAPTLRPEPGRARIVLHGELPSPLDPPAGCAFHQRCPHARPLCSAQRPPLRAFAGRQLACHRIEELHR